MDSEQSPARGRPQKFDYDEALQALVFLFWEKGYEATTQQDMMARTSLSSSSLLNTFGNKPEIFRKVLTAYVDMQREGLKFLSEGTAGLDDLLKMLTTMEQSVCGECGTPPGCLAVKSMIGPNANADGVSDQILRSGRLIREGLRAMFSRAVELDEIDSSIIEENTELLSASFTGILATGGSPGGKDTAVRMLRALRGSVESWRRFAK